MSRLHLWIRWIRRLFTYICINFIAGEITCIIFFLVRTTVNLYIYLERCKRDKQTNNYLRYRVSNVCNISTEDEEEPPTQPLRDRKENKLKGNDWQKKL